MYELCKVFCGESFDFILCIVTILDIFTDWVYFVDICSYNHRELELVMDIK